VARTAADGVAGRPIGRISRRRPTARHEALSLVDPRAAFILEATCKTLRGKATANTLAVDSRATVTSATTTVDLTITPPKITPSTPSVEITGTINNL
jgi:hypothetical protein